MDMRLEVVVIPVADVDRAKTFYLGLGWRLDADFAKGPDFPDGNSWFVQEVTTRLPGRATSVLAAYDSAAGLASALRRAEAAHTKHAQETGKPDPDWPDWYAQYMITESDPRDGG